MAMPMMNSATLIDLVYARDPLWNPRSNFYHNRQMKHLLWTEIAAELGVSLETVRTKWSCLRDSFRRELKKRQDGGFISKAQWTFFNRMLFLTTAMSSKDYSPEQDFYNDTSETFEMIANPQVLMSSGGTSCDAGNNNMEVPSTSEQTVMGEVRVKEEPTTSSQPAPITSTQPAPITSTQPAPIASTQPAPIASDVQNTRYVPPGLCRFRTYVKERHRLKRIQKKLVKEKKQNEDYHFAMSLVSSMKKVSEMNKIKMRMMVMDTINTFLVNQSTSFTEMETQPDDQQSIHAGTSW